jgi:hypothetical protein
MWRSGNVRRLLISVRTRAEVSLPILLDLDKGSPKNCQWATKIVIIQELSDPSTDARTSEARLPAQERRRCGFHFQFLLSSHRSIFHALDWPLTATAFLLPRVLDFSGFLTLFFWTSYLWHQDVLISLPCYASTACYIPQDLEEPRRPNQHPEAKGGHPFGILKAS